MQVQLFEKVPKPKSYFENNQDGDGRKEEKENSSLGKKF